MDIIAHFIKENSRKNWDKLIEYVGQDEERFSKLMDVFLTGTTKTIVGSSQAVGIISEKQPRLIKPYLNDLIGYLKSNPVDAVKRNIMRTFQFIDIPDEIEGDLFEIGMQFLKSNTEAVAIKAFSMTAVRRICEKYPELAQEALFQIEILVKENVSKGLTSRGNSELKKLERILLT